MQPRRSAPMTRRRHRGVPTPLGRGALAAPAEDWRMMLEVGHGLVDLRRGRPRDGFGDVVALRRGSRHHRHGDRLAADAGKGTGRRLMRALFSAAGDRTIRLTSTVAGRPLYESEGFRVTGSNTQYQGIATASAAIDDPRVRPATEAIGPPSPRSIARRSAATGPGCSACYAGWAAPSSWRWKAASPDSRPAGLSAAATSRARPLRRTPRPPSRSHPHVRPMPARSCASTRRERRAARRIRGGCGLANGRRVGDDDPGPAAPNWPGPGLHPGQPSPG